MADLDGCSTAWSPVRIAPVDADLGRGRRRRRVWPVALDRLADEARGRGPTRHRVAHPLRRRFATEAPAHPAVLAVGAVHTALTDAGLRGQTDIVVDAADILDVHTAAMTLASGASAVVPWLAMELAAELAGTRGAEDVTAERPSSTCCALRGGPAQGARPDGHQHRRLVPRRRVVRGPGASEAVVDALLPGRAGLARQLGFATSRRASCGGSSAPPERRRPGGPLGRPGLGRFRGDGERAPVRAAHRQVPSRPGRRRRRPADPARRRALEGYRWRSRSAPATVRDQLDLRRAGAPVPLAEVEPAADIVRRFVGAAMSLGALSPEAHQALTIGLRRLGMPPTAARVARTPGGTTTDGFRRDARIKQVASARFGVTATYLARAEQLEIKIAQGSKPGEGGQLPAER